MSEAVVTRSVEEPVSSTVGRRLRYVLAESDRTVFSAPVSVSAPASEERVNAIRRRLRESRGE